VKVAIREKFARVGLINTVMFKIRSVKPHSDRRD
jgi:hypothetical protein